MRIPHLIGLFITCCACFGQPVFVGVKGGIPTTGDIISGSLSATSESKRYTLGPMLEIGLPLGFGVEVHALYRRVGYRTVFGNFAGASSNRERANSWEIPILLTYKLPFLFVRPYVAAGFGPRTMRGSTDSTGYVVDFLTGQRTYSSGRANVNLPNSLGIMAGGGLQLGLGELRVSPEVRYTYWNSTPINAYGPQGYGFQSAQNQLDVLVGVTWKVH